MTNSIAPRSILSKTIFFVLSFVSVCLIKYYTLSANSVSVSSATLFYFWKGIYQLILFAGVAFTLYIGFYLTGNLRVPYSKLYSITLTSGFVFITYFFVVIFWFKAIQIEFTKTDVENFHPLSLYQLVGANNEAIKSFLIDLNLFELGFLISVVFLLRPFFENSLLSSFEFVLIFHGLPFLALRVVSAFLKMMLFQ